jgi:hypothetical protein
MAERPIFVPDQHAPGLVREIPFTIPWAGGFGTGQKQENIKALHAAAAKPGFSKLLEISTKSETELGRRLSAFSLTFHSVTLGDIPLECAYQGSKVFEHGGPYTDLYRVDARIAKRDPRLKASGRLIFFRFEGFDFPSEPKTLFYDWLYINTLLPDRERLQRLDRYDGFTDIEFNPARSLNCQARSCALFVSLMLLDLLDDKLRAPKKFIAMMQDNVHRTAAS